MYDFFNDSLTSFMYGKFFLIVILNGVSLNFHLSFETERINSLKLSPID